MRRFQRFYVYAFILCACLGSVSIAAQNPHVVLETNFGDIVIELYPDAAPVTVDNFLGYVNSGFYDGILFHRVIDDFMIQGGFFCVINNTPDVHMPGDPIVNEGDNGLSNVRGTISTALGDGPDTATSQFFINHKDNLHLDHDFPDGNGYGHCVFGAVVEGLDVVDAIAKTPTYDYSPWFGDAFKNFPDGPLVIINLAYELPNSFSHSSNLILNGRIDLEDFAMFAVHWLDNTCDSSNGFCDGADMDYSGQVDIADIVMFSNHWAHPAGYETRFSDLYYDNTVDLADLWVFMLNWLDTGCNPDNNYCDQADINHDGTVDFTDYALLSNNWLSTY